MISFSSCKQTPDYNNPVDSSVTLEPPKSLTLQSFSTTQIQLSWEYAADYFAYSGAGLTVDIEESVNSGPFAIVKNVPVSQTSASVSGTYTITDNYSFRARIKASTKTSLYSAVVTQSARIIPTDGLVAYYPFNGNADDKSGNGNNGTEHGATLTTDRFGRAGMAYLFGDGKYITVPNSTTLNPSLAITVSAWIDMRTFRQEHQSILSKLSSNWVPATGWSLRLTDTSDVWSHVQVVSTVNNMRAFKRGPFSYGWLHIAFTYDGTKLRHYVNSIETSNYDVTGKILSNTTPLSIGVQTGVSIYYFPGAIDDIRIYNRALSTVEIQALYHEGGW